MRTKIYLLATVFAVALPTVSFAAMPNPFTGVTDAVKESNAYVGIAGGWNAQRHSDVSGTGIDKSVSFEDGWAGLGTVGYKAASGFRGELEFGYRDNDVDTVSGTPATTGAASGSVQAWTIMANVLYDYENKTRFTPYVGVGIGAININYDNVQTIGTGTGGTIDDDTWAPAAQGIVGVAYKVHNNIDLFANYQYLTAFSNPRLQTSNGVKTDVDYDAHTVLAGVRFSFAKPKPAPVEPAPEPTPAPAPQAETGPAVPLNYTVFFNFDKSNVTPEARDILTAAAHNVQGNNIVRIDVTGHADRSGSDAYNTKLSQQRAEAVKKELVKLGVAPAEIVTAAKGESDPLVSTDDGVREPQNRRVVIVFTQGAK